MIMVIGGRCQGKSSFAREHFESRVQENKKREKDGEIQEDHLERSKGRSLGQMGKQPPGKSFLPLHLVPEFSPAGAADFKKR